MSEIKYGLISGVDKDCIEAVLNYLMNDFPKEDLHITELGIFDGQSARGISDYVISKNRGVCYHAIDNEKDKPVLRPFVGCNMIIGNSNEVYNRLPDNSQHFIFVDALHTFPAVISDFYCYADKVMVGGYMAFHDTGKHLDPLSGWQGTGDKNDPDFCLGGVRKALDKIGLLNNKLPEWKLIFDEADINDTGGGVVILKRVKQWD